MVRNNIFCQVKPEFGHLGQNSTFGGNLIVKDHVKTADTVGSNHNKAVTIVVDLTYFSFFDRF